MESLASFLDGSPSPYHAVATAMTRLFAADFTLVDERDPWVDVEFAFGVPVWWG